jgi:Ca2+-binding EF-hand superfamily protein
MSSPSSSQLGSSQSEVVIVSMTKGTLNMYCRQKFADNLWKYAQEGLPNMPSGEVGYGLTITCVRVEGRGAIDLRSPQENHEMLPLDRRSATRQDIIQLPPSPDHAAGPPSPPRPMRVRWTSGPAPTVDLATITTRLGMYITELRKQYNARKGIRGLSSGDALIVLLELGVSEEGAMMKLTDYWDGSTLSFAEFVMLYGSVTGLDAPGDGHFLKRQTSNGVQWFMLSHEDSTTLQSVYNSTITKALSSGAVLDEALLADALSLVLGDEIRHFESWISHHGDLIWSFEEFCEAYTELGGPFPVVAKDKKSSVCMDEEVREQLRSFFNRLQTGGRISLGSLKVNTDHGGEDHAMRSWVRERDRFGKGYVDFHDLVAFHERTGDGFELPASHHHQHQQQQEAKDDQDHFYPTSRSDSSFEQRNRAPVVNEYEAAASREVAIRKAFDAYDLNQDGLITYLELRTVFARANKQISEFELREWIRSRDRSNNGGVSFSDFRTAFLERYNGK